MTEIIIRGRQGGKTTELIQRAEETGGYIVCTDRQQAAWIARRAREMGARIQFPLTAEEFSKGDFYKPGISGFLFDNLDQIIQAMSGSVPVLAATWTDANSGPGVPEYPSPHPEDAR